MKKIISAALLFCFGIGSAGASDAPQSGAMQSIPNAYQFFFESIDGEDLPLSSYAGKVLLIVNTASQCGFTAQYKDLQTLYETYKNQGLVVIGVPCNDFGGQESGSEASIKAFTEDKFKITFPLTKKYTMEGSEAHPFFKWASAQKKGGLLFSKPRWNFHKFLIDKDGNIAGSFGSNVNPTSGDITNAVEALLNTPAQSVIQIPPENSTP